MTDIELERRGPGVWPWILGLMLLAVVAWALSEAVGRKGDRPEGSAPEVVEMPR